MIRSSKVDGMIQVTKDLYYNQLFVNAKLLDILAACVVIYPECKVSMMPAFDRTRSKRHRNAMTPIIA